LHTDVIAKSAGADEVIDKFRIPLLESATEENKTHVMKGAVGTTLCGKGGVFITNDDIPVVLD
jgi:homoserine kinase